MLNIEDMLPDSRSLTKEEAQNYNEVLDSLYAKTGRTLDIGGTDNVNE